MNDLQKAAVITDDTNLHINIPFEKVRREERIVSGFATTDHIDHDGDVISFSASKKAFAESVARIREQHGKEAVGKIVNFEAKSMWNEKLNKVVNGIYVEAYVSKGAPHTWEKVLDGTLAGFSIGGVIKNHSSKFIKDTTGEPGAGKTVRYIDDYELIELSLVDSPNNSLSVIASIRKSADGAVEVDGMVSDVTTENVFWNNETKELKVTTDSEVAGYENIGWIETSKSLDDEARSEQLASVLKAHLDLIKTDEGGVTMSEKEVTTEEVVEEVPTTEEVETPAPVEEAETETVDVEEVPSEDTDIQKMLQDLRSTITQTIEKTVTQSNEQHAGALAEVNEKIEKAESSLAELASLGGKYEELSKSVNKLQEKFDTMEKSIESLEADSAIKKSSDLGGSKEIKKSKSDDLWADSALTYRR